jgi:hypothetical protein
MNPVPPVPDEPADYQASTDMVWTEKAYEKLQEGGDLHGEVISRDGVMASRVWGQCPRCSHFIDDRQALTALASLMGVRGSGPGASTGTTEVRFAQVDVSCRCGDPHKGAPAGKTGCGISFRVELPVQDAGASTRS